MTEGLTSWFLSHPVRSPRRTRRPPRNPAAFLFPTPHPTLALPGVDGRLPGMAPAWHALWAPAGSPPPPAGPRPLRTASPPAPPVLWRWRNTPAHPELPRRPAYHRAAGSARGSPGAGLPPAVDPHALAPPIPGCRGCIGDHLCCRWPDTVLRPPRLA